MRLLKLSFRLNMCAMIMAHKRINEMVCAVRFRNEDVDARARGKKITAMPSFMNHFHFKHMHTHFVLKWSTTPACMAEVLWTQYILLDEIQHLSIKKNSSYCKIYLKHLHTKIHNQLCQRHFKFHSKFKRIASSHIQFTRFHTNGAHEFDMNSIIFVTVSLKFNKITKLSKLCWVLSVCNMASLIPSHSHVVW